MDAYVCRYARPLGALRRLLETLQILSRGMAACVERFDDSLMVVIDVAMLQCVTTGTRLDHDVAGHAVWSLGVAHASQIHDSDVTDLAIHYLMRVPAEHEIGIDTVGHRAQRRIGDLMRKTFSVVGTGRRVDCEHARATQQRPTELTRKIIEPIDPTCLGQRAARPVERSNALLEYRKEFHIAPHVVGRRMRQIAAQYVPFRVAREARRSNRSQHFQGPNWVVTECDDVAEHEPLVDADLLTISDHGFERDGVPMNV